MCFFQEIHNAVQNIILISAFFYNVVTTASKKLFKIENILTMCKTLSKIPNYSMCLIKSMLIKCLSQLSGQIIVYLSVFHKISKQMFSRQIVIFSRDRSLTVNPFCKLRTADLKPGDIFKKYFQNMSLQSYLTSTRQHFMLYFFEVKAPAANGDSFDENHSDSTNSKDVQNSEVSEKGLTESEEMDFEMPAENSESRQNAESLLKRKLSDEYVHKLKRIKNQSEVFEPTESAAAEGSIQQENGNGERFLASNSGQNNNSFSESHSGENQCITHESLMNVPSQEKKEILDYYTNINSNENLVATLDREINSLGKEIFSISTDKLNTLVDFDSGETGNTRYQSMLDTFSNKCKELSDKYRNATNGENSNGNGFSCSKLDESKSSSVEKRLRLIPDIEVWNNIDNEVIELKKEIERKRRNGELSNRKALNVSADAESCLVTNNDEKRALANEPRKISEIDNQLKAVIETFSLNNAETEEKSNRLERNLNSVAVQHSDSETESQPDKIDDPYTNGCLNGVKENKETSKEQENFNTLKFRKLSFEMNENSGKNNSFKNQAEGKEGEAVSNGPQSFSNSNEVSLECDEDVPPLITYFPQEYNEEEDLIVNVGTPRLPSVLDSPVSEEEYSSSEKNDQNLNARNYQKEIFVDTNNNDFRGSNHDSNFSISQNNDVCLPLPMFARPEYSEAMPPIITPADNILFQDLSRRRPVIWSESIQIDKENFSFPSLKPAATIGIDDFEVGEGSKSNEEIFRTRVTDYKPYPGMVHDATTVKKDARYQKKFYKKPQPVKTPHSAESSNNQNLPAENAHEDLSIKSTQQNGYSADKEQESVHSSVTSSAPVNADASLTEANQLSEESRDVLDAEKRA